MPVVGSNSTGSGSLASNSWTQPLCGVAPIAARTWAAVRFPKGFATWLSAAVLIVAKSAEHKVSASKVPAPQVLTQLWKKASDSNCTIKRQSQNLKINSNNQNVNRSVVRPETLFSSKEEICANDDEQVNSFLESEKAQQSLYHSGRVAGPQHAPASHGGLGLPAVYITPLCSTWCWQESRAGNATWLLQHWSCQPSWYHSSSLSRWAKPDRTACTVRTGLNCDQFKFQARRELKGQRQETPAPAAAVRSASGTYLPQPARG